MQRTWVNNGEKNEAQTPSYEPMPTACSENASDVLQNSEQQLAKNIPM